MGCLASCFAGGQIRSRISFAARSFPRSVASSRARTRRRRRIIRLSSPRLGSPSTRRSNSCSRIRSNEVSAPAGRLVGRRLIEVHGRGFFEPRVGREGGHARRREGRRPGRQTHARENAPCHRRLGDRRHPPHRLSALTMKCFDTEHSLQQVRPSKTLPPMPIRWRGEWFDRLGTPGDLIRPRILRGVRAALGAGIGRPLRRRHRRHRPGCGLARPSSVLRRDSSQIPLPSRQSSARFAGLPHRRHHPDPFRSRRVPICRDTALGEPAAAESVGSTARAAHGAPSGRGSCRRASGS